jgi:hypothetical protein
MLPQDRSRQQMKAPKCSLCGKRHYGPCTGAANKDELAANGGGFAANSDQNECNSGQCAANSGKPCDCNTPKSLDAANTKCPSLTGPVPGYMAGSRYADHGKRREYMRLYMRQKRSADRDE